VTRSDPPDTTHPLLRLDARPIVGHRGASARAPENTLPSFELALADGAEALEFDVHVSADGVPIVVHDPTLDRTTDASGAVAALPVERIQAADAGARFTADGVTFPFRGRGIIVPTLDEVLATFPDAPVLIEIKSRLASEAVKRAIAARDAIDRCLLMSFDDAALAPFREPPWLVGASSAEASRLLVGATLGRAPERVGYRALSVPPRHRGVPLPLGMLARAARRLGCPVHVWTVDSVVLARRLWSRGVAGMITNAPALIRAARDEG
jgi:glycerophosphoryl diester phosphodiesterase